MTNTQQLETEDQKKGLEGIVGTLPSVGTVLHELDRVANNTSLSVSSFSFMYDDNVRVNYEGSLTPIGACHTYTLQLTDTMENSEKFQELGRRLKNRIEYHKSAGREIDGSIEATANGRLRLHVRVNAARYQLAYDAMQELLKVVDETYSSKPELKINAQHFVFDQGQLVYVRDHNTNDITPYFNNPQIMMEDKPRLLPVVNRHFTL